MPVLRGRMARLLVSAFTVTLTLLAWGEPAEASRVQGSIHGDDFAKTAHLDSPYQKFITKFVYGTSTGEFWASFFDGLNTTYTAPAANASLLLLTPREYFEEMQDLNTCEKRVAYLKAKEKPHSYQFGMNVPSRLPLQRNVLAEVKADWWFVSFLACNYLTGEPAYPPVVDTIYEYELHLTYGSPDNKWVYEFSFEEQGVEAAFLAFFILYCPVLIAHCYVHLKYGHGMHSIVRLFTVCVFLEFACVFFNFIHYARFSGNGTGLPGLRDFGNFLQLCSQCLFMALLLVIAKGWTITTSAISNKRALAITLAVYAGLYLILFIWQKVGISEESTKDEWQTWPGGLILTMRLLMMLWFLYELRSTYLQENSPEKLRFYQWFGIGYTVWFTALPVVVIIAACVVSPWRFKVIVGLFVAQNWVFFVIMVFLMWPTRSARVFQLGSGAYGGIESASHLPYGSA